MPASTTPSEFNRRTFLGESARGVAGVTVGVMGFGAVAPNETIGVGVIGLGQQGRALLSELTQLNGISVRAVCDVDIQSISKGMNEFTSQATGTPPVVCTAHEQLLDREDIHAVIIATPDHWHARMAIDACLAGKDVYLEMPVAHSIADGMAICKAAAKTQRVVQTGLPQRSGTHYRSAVQLLHRGEIGKVHLAKAWSVHKRRSIGRCATSTPPVGVDYERWLGPAASRKFQANRFHNDWPWFWDYGSGELGLWGAQLLDVARWGLNLELPDHVAASGSNRVFRDDRETPDSLLVQYRYPEIDIIWEHRQWCTRGIEGRMAATAFYGDHGTLIIDRSGWKVYDSRDRHYADASEIKQSHLQDFFNCVRSRKSPHADLQTGQISSTLCHLGNLAYQTGIEINVQQILATLTSPLSSTQAELLTATHRAPWELPEIS